MFHIITIGGKDYECRLTTKNLLKAEERLGSNPLSIFMTVSATGELPPMKALLVLFHESLPANINFDKACDLYDAYIDEGHSFVDFMNDVIEIMRASGLIPKDDGETKNA